MTNHEHPPWNCAECVKHICFTIRVWEGAHNTWRCVNKSSIVVSRDGRIGWNPVTFVSPISPCGQIPFTLKHKTKLRFPRQNISATYKINNTRKWESHNKSGSSPARHNNHDTSLLQMFGTLDASKQQLEQKQLLEWLTEGQWIPGMSNYKCGHGGWVFQRPAQTIY